MADRHVRRGPDDYWHALSNLLPTGIAWTRDPESVLQKVVKGIAAIFGFVDARAADLLETETDPRLTLELLPDWERNFGLPDECFPAPSTIAERRAALVQKMTTEGGQSKSFFIGVAASLGHEIKIEEFSPFMCGLSRCGGNLDTDGFPRWQIATPEIRFYWTAHVGQVRLTWFRAGQSQAGVDHHLKIDIPLDLDCLLNRWKPAQTDLVFDFSGSTSGGPLAGTP